MRTEQENNDKTLEKLEVELCQHKLNSIKEKVGPSHSRVPPAPPPSENRSSLAKSFLARKPFLARTPPNRCPRAGHGPSGGSAGGERRAAESIHARLR